MEQGRDDQLQQIAESSKKSTVCLKTKFVGLTAQVGSGFFVEPDKIATNIHVIEGVPGFNVKAITAKQFENERIPIRYRFYDAVKNRILRLFRRFFTDLKAEKNGKSNESRNYEDRTVYTIEGVTAFDDKNDLVVLKITETGVPLPLGNSDNLENGEQVYIVGYDDKKYKSVAGTISGGHNSDKLLQIKVKLPTEQIDGYSGGPVLNGRGEIIGVVKSAVESDTNKSSTISHSFVNAIPLNVLKALMSNSGHVEPITEWRRHPQIRAYTKTDLGNRKLANGKYKQAIAYYDAALKRNPNLAYVYLKRGNAKDELGDLEGAMADYDNAIHLNPEDAVVYYNRGHVKGKLGDYVGAIKDYDNAIKLNPEDVSTYNNRGYAKDELGDYEGAIADYDYAIRLNPEDADLYNNRGNAKDELGDAKGAIADYDYAIRLNPEDAVVYYNRGIVKKVLGDTEGAIADYDDAIRLNPEDADFYYSRGEAKKALEQHEAAEADFAKAKELYPDLKNRQYVLML